MAEESQTQHGKEASSWALGELFGLGIAFVVGVAAATAGYGLGRLFVPEQAQGGPADQQAYQQIDQQLTEQTEDYKYYEFTPITVNLKEPRLDRYIRATITLAVKKDDWNDGGGKSIEEREPQLRNWLTVYFSEQTLDDVRGKKKLNRIRREIKDAINDQLGGFAPLVDQVLFKEFAVQ